MKIVLFSLVCLIGVLNAQTYVKRLYGNNSYMLVGISPREAYQDSIFSGWFNSEYTKYQVNTKLMSQYTEKFENKIIKIVLGTWCIDSKREVPRIIKILDFINFPDDKIQFINVDREKKGLENEVDELNIEFVPTLIIFESGKEIGRIIETPLETLEQDLVKIVN